MFQNNSYRIIKAAYHDETDPRYVLRHEGRFKITAAQQRGLEEKCPEISGMSDQEYYEWLQANFPRHDEIDGLGQRQPAYKVSRVVGKNLHLRKTIYCQDGLPHDPSSGNPAVLCMTSRGVEYYRGHYRRGQALDPARGRFAEIWRSPATGLVDRAVSHTISRTAAFAAAARALSSDDPGLAMLMHLHGHRSLNGRLRAAWNEGLHVVRCASIAEVAAMNGRTEAQEIDERELLVSPDSAVCDPAHP